jgi:hypothetical protein
MYVCIIIMKTWYIILVDEELDQSVYASKGGFLTFNEAFEDAEEYALEQELDLQPKVIIRVMGDGESREKYLTDIPEPKHFGQRFTWKILVQHPDTGEDVVYAQGPIHPRRLPLLGWNEAFENAQQYAEEEGLDDVDLDVTIEVQLKNTLGRVETRKRQLQNQ